MKPEIKAKWLRDLRSGKFKQCEEALRHKLDDEVSYCCLGVLCVTVGAHWERDDRGTKRPIREGTFLQMDDDEMISDECMELAGLSSTEADMLARMNDDGHSFSEIADYIEAHL